MLDELYSQVYSMLPTAGNRVFIEAEVELELTSAAYDSFLNDINNTTLTLGPSHKERLDRDYKITSIVSPYKFVMNITSVNAKENKAKYRGKELCLNIH